MKQTLCEQSCGDLPDQALIWGFKRYPTLGEIEEGSEILANRRAATRSH